MRLPSHVKRAPGQPERVGPTGPQSILPMPIGSTRFMFTTLNAALPGTDVREGALQSATQGMPTRDKRVMRG
jgi:hypothetical protein